MNRRHFVSLAGRIIAFIVGSRLWPAWGATSPTELDEMRRASLQAAVDEIIPAGGAMPLASGAGALPYLERRRAEEPAFAKNLDAGLESLDRLCHESSGVAFSAASREQRIGALRALESSLPQLFAELRDTTYEAYYTNPEVWRLIGYDFRASPVPTAVLPEFDQTLLARVRRMAPFHRKAG
jgi:hypothetical protein